MISGIVTAILLAAFVGIAVWTWSAGNRERWHRAAQAPLHDDEGSVRPCGAAHERCGS